MRGGRRKEERRTWNGRADFFIYLFIYFKVTQDVLHISNFLEEKEQLALLNGIICFKKIKQKKKDKKG